MAKISPVSIKYMIYADFEAVGTVEKPDVIGAVFGQTEGLLGSDMEMRDLQKEGKIGRIEVSLNSSNGKTIGKIQIPSALDKTETTLIGAALETIEKIGPSEAKIAIEKIEDVRENKRQYILDRAKKLLEEIEEKMPKTREMTSNLKTESRISKIKEYGSDNLPSGDITGNEVIVVEGRADVINLLRNGVNNVIAMNGTVLPETIKELSREKEIILFVDGDRGGKLIIKNVTSNANISYIAMAPEGKEVEELTDKEILSSLRKKVPVREFLGTSSNNYYKRYEEKPAENPAGKYEKKEFTDEERKKLKSMLDNLGSSRTILILDDNLEIIGRTTPRTLLSSISRAKNPSILIANTLTPSLVRNAEKTQIKNIAARKFNFTGNTIINLISL